MTINRNLRFFNNKPVKDFNPETGVEKENVAYRFRVEYDDANTVESLLQKMLESPNAAELEDLVIGIWSYDGDSSLGIINLLVENNDKLPKLKSIMFGDITYEENEISWIEQDDMTPLLNAFPNLEIFHVRGGNGLNFNNLTHNNLKSLIIETGGMYPDTIDDIAKANLPNLEHLELWLGSSYYGFESKVEDLKPFMSKSKFPKLTYLGLRDSEIADEIAVAFKDADILDILETLDLSKGALGNEGAEALFNNPKIKQLKYLDLHYHYMSEEWVAKLDTLGIQVNLSDGQGETDKADRYVAVSE